MRFANNAFTRPSASATDNSLLDNNKSITWWGTSRSRKIFFKRSVKNSSTWLSNSSCLSAATFNNSIDALKIGRKLIFHSLPSKMFKIPIVWRRNAYGSWEPVGIKPRLKVATILSTLSIMDNTLPASVWGNTSPAKRGKYCSKIASATSGDSPSSKAYSFPITPCNSVNSVTIPVVRSVLASSVARSNTTAASSCKPHSSPNTRPNLSKRSVLSAKLPRPSWNTILVKPSWRSIRGFLRSSLKKNLASSRRARNTRSLPAWTTSMEWSEPLRTVKNIGNNLPSWPTNGK